MSYFLLSVSNRLNLELCIKHAIAGFTNSINGLWTFLEIQEGDFVSFLYGAKAYNLYQVDKKEAFQNANRIPPWPSVTFKISGKTYYFPFRLQLKPIRKLEEPLVRAEFTYVAENLLLRGGYRKTHFQADQTTLQAVSQMGMPYDQKVSILDLGKYPKFSPKLTWDRTKINSPEVFYFTEIILQSIIRQHLSQLENLDAFLSLIGVVGLKADKLEILGEKALPEGHIDLLIKEATPTGLTRKIIIEVKLNNARAQDIDQISDYMQEIGNECLAGVLIARNFSKKVIDGAKEKRIRMIAYSLDEIDKNQLYEFEELKSKIRLVRI